MNKKINILILIPTYNERDNVKKLYEQISMLHPDAHVLFVDDNSPDGTGAIIDEIAAHDNNIHVLNRPSKLGIGGAHQAGICWAYDNGCKILVSMDSDFTHLPGDINKFLKYTEDYDVVVGSRYLEKNSISEWNLFRKFLTNTGHCLSKYSLDMPYDATGAFRAYRLDRIQRRIFNLVSSRGYSFFFESLYVLNMNKYKIKEIPIILPKRTYGSSKMRFKDIHASVCCLTAMNLYRRFRPDLFIAPTEDVFSDKNIQDSQNWDEYWRREKTIIGFLYDATASFYRRFIIKPNLRRFLKNHFNPGSKLLHAGCGGGQVDEGVTQIYSITALDISPCALHQYRQNHKSEDVTVMQGTIFSTELPAESFDGIYNLGVMEHFSIEEISAILSEFHRLLKPGGKAVLFWPPEYGSSVIFMKCIHLVIFNIMGRSKLHPDEPSRIKSAKSIRSLATDSGFEMTGYYFGIRDLFTYAVVVLRKPESLNEL